MTTTYLTPAPCHFHITGSFHLTRKVWCGVVIPITISSQNDHTSCLALVDTGSPVTLLSETIKLQLNLAATPLKSHYHLVGATG